jgi:hypothetical protein
LTWFRKLIVVLGIFLVAVGAVVLGHRAFVEAFGSDEMDYRGEKIRLSKKYVDYDVYKNDPDNLAASEIPRVEKMMTDAKVGPDFADWRDAAHQLSDIKFPGYGMAGGDDVVSAGREFAVRSVEIPQVAKERYFVLEKLAGGAYRLADDFVLHREPGSAFAPIFSIRLVEDKLVYADRSGRVVRETTVAR